MDIYVPYNPLEGILHGTEIELSNCPSFEIDNDGNIIIAFGKSSKQPTRKDNNYAELVEGWKDAFGDYEPEILKVNAESLSTFGDEQKIFLYEINIACKNCRKFVGIIYVIEFRTTNECDSIANKFVMKIAVGISRAICRNKQICAVKIRCVYRHKLYLHRPL